MIIIIIKIVIMMYRPGINYRGFPRGLCASPNEARSNNINDNDKHTPSLPTKSLDVRGFDSSKLLILRGGNYHIHRI